MSLSLCLLQAEACLAVSRVADTVPLRDAFPEGARHLPDGRVVS